MKKRKEIDGMDFTLIATATFGLEKIVANELKDLGYDNLVVENGKVTFQGTRWT
jgi:putative N6-adenine-specific DNA methylase